MIILACAPSNAGKTYLVKTYVLPVLLTSPRELTEAAPERFDFCFIDDPPSSKNPHGQYPGERYTDVNEWKRAKSKARVCCFDRADPDELCALALKKKNVILVLDELDLRWPSSQPLKSAAKDLVNRGRHEGVALVGTMRRLHGVRPELRANMQVAFFGGLSEPDDRKYAAMTTGVDEKRIARVEPRTFLEWRREVDYRGLTKIENSRRVEIMRL